MRFYKTMNVFLDGCAERVEWRCPRFLYPFVYFSYWAAIGIVVLMLALTLKDGLADRWQVNVLAFAVMGFLLLMGIFGVTVMRRAYRILERRQPNSK